MVAFRSGEGFERFNAWSAVEWLLAVAAIGLIIAGLIVGSKVLFVILAADLLTLWVASLARHTLSHEETETPRHLHPAS